MYREVITGHLDSGERVQKFSRNNLVAGLLGEYELNHGWRVGLSGQHYNADDASSERYAIRLSYSF